MPTDIENLTPQQLRRKERLEKLFEEGEVGLLKYLFEVDEKMDEHMAKMEEKLETKLAEIEASQPDLNKVLESVKGKDGKDGSDSEVPGPKGDKGDKGDSGKDGKNGRDGRDGVDGLNGKDGRDGKDGKDGVNGKDGSPDTPKQIVEKLESLNGDDRLDKKAIKGLDEELISIRATRASGAPRTPAGTYYVIPVDGVTKTFTIPKYRNVAAVLCSSSPWVMKATTDYTLAGNSITFTSQISAESTLAADQTVVVLYTPLFAS